VKTVFAALIWKAFVRFLQKYARRSSTQYADVMTSLIPTTAKDREQESLFNPEENAGEERKFFK